jgi:lipoate---protein ligase
MQRFDFTMPSAAENVWLDEWLLDYAEGAAGDVEFLRIWESLRPLVVTGRSSRIEEEVNTAYCTTHKIPVVGRSSGGAAIVAGPGCLMYAVVVSHRLRPELKDITLAHRFVLDRIVSAINSNGVKVKRAGTSDLVIASTNAPTSQLKKFSGNSLRVKRTHFLYHGTLLYNFDLSLIANCLRTPPRQPEYRDARPHQDFVANLPLSKRQLIDALDTAWPTSGALTIGKALRIGQLVDSRFIPKNWNVDADQAE